MFYFFLNDSASTELYTLSLHDALPILQPTCSAPTRGWSAARARAGPTPTAMPDRKSTRLNSSHEWTSYAVFFLKKKTTHVATDMTRLWTQAISAYSSCLG